MTDDDGREASLVRDPRPIAAVLRRDAHAHPDMTLLTDNVESLTYGAAERRSARLARGLVALGAGKGTRVGLLYTHRAPFVVGMLAAARIGAVAVSFPGSTTARELREQLVHSDVHFLLAAGTDASHDYVQLLSEVLADAESDAYGRLYCTAVPQLRYVAIDGAPAKSRFVPDIARYADEVDEELLQALEDDVHGSDPLADVYTYSSTGAPTHAVYRHADLRGFTFELFAGSTMSTSDDSVVCAPEPSEGHTADADVYPAADTMDRLLRDRATHARDVPAVIEPEDRLTYGELDSTTRDLAAVLVAAGVGKGTPVGVLLPNGTRWVRVAAAVTRIGAVLVPLSTLLRPPELRTQLQVASVQFLVTVEEFRGRRYLDDLAITPAEVHDPALPALRRVWTIDQLEVAPALPPATRIVDALAETVTASDPFVIMFTSGSRGLPKGVIHSYGSAFGAVRAGLEARLIDAGTRLYLPMPFFWVGGFGGGVLSALLAGATLVTESIPRPEATLELLRRERVTLFRGWPDQAESLARQAEMLNLTVPTLRPGSLDALLPVELRAEPGARANLFGMTEAFGPYCGYPADTDMPRSAWGSCGKPFPGTEVRITVPDSGRLVPAGQTGIIEIRGPHMLRGMVRRFREELFTSDGFYRTGDLGSLDAVGFLFYQGRSDDMFKVSGATVYPSEVEQALRTIDGVRNAFVTNVPGPHGDRVGAAVVCDTTALTPESLRSTTRESLSAFKVPELWVLMDSDEQIPRGQTGKVDPTRLRGLFQASHQPPSNPEGHR